MSDVFTTATIDEENATIKMTDQLQELLDELEIDYYQLARTSIINERWNEDKEASAYILTEYVFENGEKAGERMVGCTCSGFRYHEMVYAQDVRAGESSLEDIGDCKHKDYYKKQSKHYEKRAEGQSGFEEHTV